MRTWIVDTGPLVAYLDGGDPHHAKVAASLEGFSGRLVTTSAVITEAMHFLSSDPDGPTHLAEFAQAANLEVYDLSSPPELIEAASLMKKYGDTPMDFADATVLLLAEALDVGDILTLDRRGFSTYRTRHGRALQLVLDG